VRFLGVSIFNAVQAYWGIAYDLKRQIFSPGFF
jgi:hypothetical protein